MGSLFMMREGKREVALILYDPNLSRSFSFTFLKVKVMILVTVFLYLETICLYFLDRREGEIKMHISYIVH